MKKTQFITLLAALPLALSMSACSSNDSKVVENEAPPAAEAAESEAPAEETPAEDEVKRPAFGDTVEYRDGLKLTVSEPEEFTPSEFAFGAEKDGTPLKFTVTIENGTDKDFDPNLIALTMGSGGAESDQIFDGDDIGNAPTTTVLPGKSVTWVVGFNPADTGDMVMDVIIMDDVTRAKTTYVK